MRQRWTSPGAPSGRSLLNRNLLGICLGFFCFDYYWYVLVTWLPDYLVTVRHLSIVQAGFYASLAFFTFGIAEPIGGWIADSLIRRGWDEHCDPEGDRRDRFHHGGLSHRSNAHCTYRFRSRTADWGVS